jgi:hypothetical protein
MIRLRCVILVLLVTTGAHAAPRVWLVDQGNNQQGGANPNNRIFEIDPVNHKSPPDAEGDVIVLRTLPSPAGAWVDELTFDNQARLWCVVKHTSDQSADGMVRIDKETGAAQAQFSPVFSAIPQGGILEGAAWDGTALWITAVRDGVGPSGSALSRYTPAGVRAPPFASGPLSAVGWVGVPGVAQGLLFDAERDGSLWYSVSSAQQLYRLEPARLTDGDPGNDDDLVVAGYPLPFVGKGMSWMGGQIWISSPHDGIYAFDPETGTTTKIFSTPAWNIDGIAVLPDEPIIAAEPDAITRMVYTAHALDDAVVTIRNAGSGTIEYTVAADAPWMTITPGDGQSSGAGVEHTIHFDVAALPAGVHLASITIADPDALYPELTVPVSVEVRPGIGDLDGDGDVDQVDFGQFQRCLTGEGIVQSDPACATSRLDGDLDVDAADMALFLACHNGPNVLPPPACFP